MDFHDKTPLVGATIEIIGLNKVASSDLDGKFILKGLCNGSYEVEVFHPECTSRILTVLIEGDTFQKITLEHHLEKLGEVTVTGENNKAVAKP